MGAIQKAGLSLAAAWIGWGLAAAAPLPADELERECWLKHTRERTRVKLVEPTAVDVSNLREGQTVSSPFRVDFSIRGMGVAPAGKPHPKAGHHHLLVDTPLPMNPGDKIPFNDFHRHFGKGQTGTVISLPPGAHRVRLLFADHDHRPYFVFSPEITVEVLGPRSAVPRPKIDPKNFELSCAAWYQDEVSRPRPPEEPLHFTNLRAGEVLVSPFNVRLGVDGYGVCARGQSAEKTGHFILEVLARADRKPVQSFDLSNGATQANLFIGVGSYLLRLRFVDPANGADLLRPHELPVSVSQQDRI